MENEAKDDRQRSAVQERLNGRSNASIARELAVSRRQIGAWCKVAGLPERTRQKCSAETKAYAIAEYNRGRSSTSIGVELELDHSTILDWVHAAGHPTCSSPYFKEKVVIPEGSAWKFIEHRGTDPARRNQRVALFECTRVRPDGTICRNRRVLVVNQVVAGRTRSCRAHMSEPRKALTACSYEYKRRHGIVTRRERDEFNRLKRAEYEKVGSKHKAKPRGRAVIMCKVAQRSAEKRGLPFDLDVPYLESLLTVGKCNVTKVPFDNGPTLVKHRPNMFVPSIDRIDPSRGYVKGNVQIVVHVYNLLKSDYPQSEIIAFIKRAYKGIVGNNESEESANAE